MPEIKIVVACPTSKQKWEKAADDMNCNKFATGKNCKDKSNEYHCVINEYTNETLEVCAPSRIIFGNADTVVHALLITL